MCIVQPHIFAVVNSADVALNMDTRKEAQQALSSPEHWDEESKNSKQTEVSILIAIDALYSCNDGLSAGVTLTLHFSQVRYSGVMQR